METAMRRTKCLRETPKTLSDQAEWLSRMTKLNDRAES